MFSGHWRDWNAEQRERRAWARQGESETRIGLHLRAPGPHALAWGNTFETQRRSSQRAAS